MKESLTFTADSTPMSQLLLNVMGSFAEFERALIRERQREGVTLAKAKGVYKGRKPSLTDEQVITLRQRVAAGGKKAALARELKVSRITVHRYLRAYPDVKVVPNCAVAAPSVDSTIVLTLWLELCPYDKHVRTKRLVDEIEDWVLSRYQTETIHRGSQYTLTVRYKDAADLEGKMADLWYEIGNRAEARRCDVQGDILDEQGRCWGDGTLERHPEQYTNSTSSNDTSKA